MFCFSEAFDDDMPRREKDGKREYQVLLLNKHKPLKEENFAYIANICDASNV